MTTGDESLSTPSCPWLMMSSENQAHITNLSSGTCYDLARDVPALLGKRVCCSCQEWLLLSSITTASDCCLLNLFSKETIQLPSVDFSYDFCLLSSPPTDPACRVVFFVRRSWMLMVWQPGDTKYAEHVWHCNRFPNGHYTIAEGKVYLLCGITDVLVRLEFEGSTYRRVVLQMNFMNPRKSEKRFPYIVECSGEIFLCYVIDDTSYQIFKADLSNRRWIEVTSIGPHAFLLAHSMRFPVVALDSTLCKPNSIYTFNRHIPRLYAYDLGKGALHRYPVYCHTAAEDYKLDWIMMPHDRSFGKILQRNKEKGLHKKRTLVKKNMEELDRITEVHDSWSALPPDIVSLIGSNLFGVDYVRFLAVCKPWKLLATQYRVPPSLAQESCAPLLMFQENPSAHTIPVYRFFDPVKRMSYCVEIPELREAKIWYSSEGWLLVSRRPGCFYFLNPLTQQRIELRRNLGMYDSDDGYILSFSSSPTSSNCLVVAMDASRRWIFTLKHGEDRWTWHHLSRDASFETSPISSPVVVDNGLHYYLLRNGGVLVINLQEGSSFSYKVCVVWPLEGFGSSENFLVEINGAPALVTVPVAEGKVRVFQLSKSRKDWREMVNVNFGDKEMFLSEKSWLLEKIEGGGMGNTIFFPLIDDDEDDGGNDGVFYSFATHKYHSFYNGYSCTAPYFVGKPVGGVWVKPVRTRFDEPNLKWSVRL